MAQKRKIKRIPIKPQAQAETIKGLGDVVEKITEATGIKAVVKAALGEDCGCDERKEKLNKLFQFNKDKMKCLTDGQIEYLNRFKKIRQKDFYEASQVKRILTIHNEVFGFKTKVCTHCGGALATINRLTNQLMQILSTYE